MPRSVSGIVRHKRVNKTLKRAKGYYGRRSKLHKSANQAVMKGLVKAYIDRRQKKRQFRQLWIAKINAACRLHGLSYSKFMNGLKKSDIDLNRKMLAELAMNNEDAFNELITTVKKAIAA